MNDFCYSVTGKQVLRDAATLAKDTGIYIVSLGIRAVRKLKKLVKAAECSEKNKDTNKGETTAVSA